MTRPRRDGRGRFKIGWPPEGKLLVGSAKPATPGDAQCGKRSLPSDEQMAALEAEARAQSMPHAMIGLVEVLTCPGCKRLVIGKDPEVFAGALTCGSGTYGAGRSGHRDGCGTHWWASRFQAGSIRAQLLADYEGDGAFVEHLMNHFGLPESIDRPMFWEIELTGNQLYRYNRDASPGVRGRSMTLLKGVLARFQRAS